MSELVTNPIIAALKENEGAVQVTGFVEKNENGRVRLYVDLDPGAYLEFDARDVIHAIDSDQDDEPARLYLRDSAEIDIVARSKVKAEALRQSGGRTSGKSCADESFDYWWDCVQRPGSDIDFCTRMSKLRETICELARDHGSVFTTK